MMNIYNLIFSLANSSLQTLAINKGYKNKKDVRLVSYVHQLAGIAKRLNQTNIEETIFPRPF